MMNDIANSVGFDYEVQLATGNTVGKLDDKGNWNGLIKDLIDNKADIGLGAISLTIDRQRVVDLTDAYYDLVGITIMMKVTNIPSTLFKFLTVFDDEVWYCVLAALFFTCIMLWILNKWHPYKTSVHGNEHLTHSTLRECLWFCLASLASEGSDDIAKRLYSHLLAGTWWLYGFIIVATYTANLSAYLTLTRLENPVTSIDDLLNQYTIQYAPHNGSYAASYFEKMANMEARFQEMWQNMVLNDSLSVIERSQLAVWDYPLSFKYTKIWQAMKDAGLPASLEEATVRVKNSNSTQEFAYIGDATDIRYLELTNCDLKLVGEQFSRRPYVLAFPKGSKLKDSVNSMLIRILGHRTVERFMDKWWTKNPNKANCGHIQEDAEGIGSQSIGGVFVVIGAGIVLTIVILPFEVWYYRFRKRSIVDISTRRRVLRNTLSTRESSCEDFGSTMSQRRHCFQRRENMNAVRRSDPNQ